MTAVLDDALERVLSRSAATACCAEQGHPRELRKSGSTWRGSTTNCRISRSFSATGISRRIYETISARFHLGDWHRSIDDKLKTLDDLYRLLRHDRTNRWMLVLEVTIVLFFVIDLLLLALGFKF